MPLQRRYNNSISSSSGRKRAASAPEPLTSEITPPVTCSSIVPAAASPPSDNIHHKNKKCKNSDDNKYGFDSSNSSAHHVMSVAGSGTWRLFYGNNAANFAEGLTAHAIEAGSEAMKDGRFNFWTSDSDAHLNSTLSEFASHIRSGLDPWRACAAMGRNFRMKKIESDSHFGTHRKNLPLTEIRF
jgi:hypothetical protein